MDTVLKSERVTLTIGSNRPTVLVGERINPTGRKRLAEALGKGDLGIVRTEALSQVEAGADVLDINVGAAGVNEVALLPEAVRLVAESVDVPICMDSADAKALRAALTAYRSIAPHAKPLINSVNGDEARLNQILPLVAEHKTAVIGLTMDETGIPATAQQRLEVARKIVERAESLGIPREDVIIDCLALTVGADSRAALVTLDAIRMVHEELGVNLTLGASNVSFGLPDREIVNWAYLITAISLGVNCPIVDVAKVRAIVLAEDLILGRDNYAMRYLKAYKKRAKGL